MPPTSNSPRELLWYHQLQRENRHLLDLVKKQAIDIEKLTTLTNSTAQERQQLQNLLSSLEAKAASTTQGRREEFEREKEILKRVVLLEERVEVLRRQESQVVVGGGGSQWEGLEQRVDALEERQERVGEGDVEQLRLRIDALGKAMDVMLKRSSVVVEPSTDIQDGGEHETEDTSEQATEDDAEAEAVVPEVPAEKQIARKRSTETASGKNPINKPELTKVTAKSLAGRRIMPFRPTPPDLGW
ncbi:hypothetical protein E4T39_00275 [Aureobasidium subglaciale]|nr:hypothetical protein E4T39_00275 [Aureobasidium subglaciale]